METAKTTKSSSTRTAGPNSLQGFTLLEMVTTVAIATILAAAALPTFKGLNDRVRLNCAAREIVSDIASARMNAVGINVEYRILFGENAQYIIAADTDKNGSIEESEEISTIDIQGKYYGVNVTASANPRFYPRGTALGSTITISKSGISKTITINAAGIADVN
jgi:type IV fimbrial biogenesis protein FimT